jgi:hypothetical protein
MDVITKKRINNERYDVYCGKVSSFTGNVGASWWCR